MTTLDLKWFKDQWFKDHSRSTNLLTTYTHCRLKDKNDMLISIDVEKSRTVSFYQRIKNSKDFLYQIRSLSQLSLTGFTLIGEMLEGMLLKSESRQWCLSSLFVCQLESLANAVRQERERKVVRIRQEDKATGDHISYSSIQNTQENPEANYCHFLAR